MYSVHAQKAARHTVVVGAMLKRLKGVAAFPGFFYLCDY